MVVVVRAVAVNVSEESYLLMCARLGSDCVLTAAFCVSSEVIGVILEVSLLVMECLLGDF